MERDILERKEYYGFLFSIYGQLLSKASWKRMQSFYFEDLSITEIAQNDNVSRSAVFDSLRKGQKELEKYEDALQLGKKSKESLQLINDIENTTDSEKKKKLWEQLKGVFTYGI